MKSFNLLGLAAYSRLLPQPQAPSTLVQPTASAATLALSLLPLVLPLLLVLLAGLLLRYGAQVTSAARKDSRQAPPLAPVCLPLLGHLPLLFLVGLDNLLAGLRSRYPAGVFSLRFFGQLHHMVHRPSLANALMIRSHAVSDQHWFLDRLLLHGFSLSRQDVAHHATMVQAAKAQFKYLHAEPDLSKLVDRTLAQVRRQIAHLVTFHSSPARQTPWERAAAATLVLGPGGQPYVELDLTELSRNFVAHTANPALFGSDFVRNFPDMWQLMWIFDEAFLPLVANLPRWLPWPRLQRARRARARMLAHIRLFHAALDRHADGQDPGSCWQNLADVSALVRARCDTYRRHGLSLEARAGCDLALAWAMNGNANHLIPWMLFELYRDPALLELIRHEVAPFVKLEQAKPPGHQARTLGEVDLHGLMNDCPHLKASYIETLRLYSATWAMKRLNENLVLGERGKTESYVLPKGSYAHVAQEMHLFDPVYFPDPTQWRHERHLKERMDEKKGEIVLEADMGTMRPYGMSPAHGHICPPMQRRAGQFRFPMR